MVGREGDPAAVPGLPAVREAGVMSGNWWKCGESVCLRGRPPEISSYRPT